MTRQPLIKSHLFPVEPEVLVNIQQLNIEQPREVNFGLGKQYLESSKGAMAEKHKRRPNDKFLEAFYNRSILLPPVLRKIISIQRLLRKSSQEDNDDIDIGTAAPFSCGESGRCLTQDNQTRSKQLDIDIQPLIDRDVQTNPNNHTDTSLIAHGPDVGNKKEVRKENSDQNTGQTSPPSDKNIDTDTASAHDIDIPIGYSILNDSNNAFRQDTSNKNKNSSILRFGQQNISFVAILNGFDYNEVANLSTDASNKTSYDGFGEFESGYRSLRARDVLDGRVDLGENQPLHGGGVQCLQDCSFESADQVEQLNLLTPTGQDPARQRDIAKVLFVLARLLAKDTVSFLLAESLAPASKKWRFVVNDVEVESIFLFRHNFRKPQLSENDILFQVTLKEEEMERAEKIERYMLEETSKWNLKEDKKLVFLRCQVFGIC